MAERLPPGVWTRPGADASYEYYDYNTWLDGSTWRLFKGTDFHVSPKSMQANLHAAARRRGIRIQTRRDSHRTIIVRKVGTR